MKSTGKGSLAKGSKVISQAEIARALRQSDPLHNPRRLRRTITSTGKPKSPDWTPQELALLGKMPDAELAKRLGRTVGAVALRRSRLNIANYGHPAGKFKRWTPGEVALLGTVPDRLLARKLKRTRIAVNCKREQLGIPAQIEGYHRWRPEDEAILGQRSDEYIAKQLGISVVAVRDRRHALKILKRPRTPRFFQE
jgi:hypothetical protein